MKLWCDIGEVRNYASIECEGGNAMIKVILFDIRF